MQKLALEIKKQESRFVLAGEIFLTRVTDLCAFLEVLLHAVEKLEEIRGLSCGETGGGRVVLVWVIFASKLSVVDLYFNLERSKPESEDCE